METTTRLQFEIPEQNLQSLTFKIEKLNKRAAKLGCPAIMFFVGREEFRHTDKHGHTCPADEAVRSIKFYHVSVVGESPKLNGWMFAAKLQHEEGGNILRTAPQFEGNLPLAFRTADPGNCDHCRTHRNRHDTYVVVNEEGEFKQVGRNCLADFLGHASAQAAAEWAELLFNLSDDLKGFSEESSSGTPYYVPMALLLAEVVYINRTTGYVTRKQAMEAAERGEDYRVESTPSRLFNLHTSRNAQVMRMAKELQESLLPQDFTTAQAAQEWALTLPATGSDFDWNLRTIAQKEMLTYKEMGLACYIVPAYLRAMESEADRIAREAAKNSASRPASAWVGTPKQRMTGELKVTNSKVIEGIYTSTLISFEDAQGNRLKWFASGCLLGTVNNEDGSYSDVWEVGKTYNVKFTVKAHNEWKGVKETLILRVATV